ncbi:ABC transporter substrate-binding protein [Pseudomonas schmalbachii]|uniref:ABC transporter substrate-binding protein n=1 Tax=Pseudomonas schmalbachii TaxID=2816993 RepID=A0ABS3TYE4_9PSED|nr:ABC transporter substrate-binding protein [Pseudomonas schmalbachii]MBO3278203.1 ABC transporter substrate-binding protein [Pseudomonas schmalbachii]
MPWLLPGLLQAGDGSLAAVFGQQPAAGRVRRIFAAGPPAAVLVYCLAPDKLLGWPWPLTEEKRSLIAPAQRDLPVLGGLAGRASTISMETLVRLAPDLIVDAGTADATFRSANARASEQTGIPCVSFAGRLADSPLLLREASARFGVEARGERLANHAQAILERSRNGSHRLGTVYLARGPDGLETGLGGSIHSEAVELAGLENVAARLGSGGLARVSLEQLLDWQPDIVLCQDAGLQQYIRQSALWRNLPAVRANRVYRAPALPFGWLDGPPGLNRLLGLEWLLALTDPSQVAALPQRVREFFSLFYSMEPSEMQIRQLLSSHPNNPYAAVPGTAFGALQ